MVDTAGPQPSLRDLETAAFPQQHIRRRHADIPEDHFRRAVRHPVESEHRQRTAHLHAGRVHRHEDHRLLLVAVRIIGIRLSHEDADPAARIGRVGRVPFVAVDDVGIAVAPDRALDIGGVARRHGRLGHREAGADFAGKQRLEPLLLMRPRSVAREHFHVTGVRRAAVEDFRREMRPPHDLAQGCIFEIAEARAVIALGQEQVPQALRLRERLQLLDDRIDLPGAEFLRLAIMPFLVRIDVRVHEGEQPALQIDDPVGFFEDHYVSPSGLRASVDAGL